MTAVTTAPAASRRRPAGRPGLATLRLLRLELRHNAMGALLPVAIVLFWLTTYRKTMAMPPLWNLRADSLQLNATLDFAIPVTGAAAWMGSREARRRIIDQVMTTARPRWTRLLIPWAATTIWALVAYLGCVAVLYGATAHQASWGGPLWWPAAVAAATIPAFSALGFLLGTFLPSRFTAPLGAIAAFFILALSTELIHGSQSYWQVSPIVTGPWDMGPQAGVATFYPFVPDLSIAQVMLLGGLAIALLGAIGVPAAAGGRRLRAVAACCTIAGLLAAGTAVKLAGTGTMDAQGMIDIPTLHNAASNRPLQFTPVCSRTAIPVCLNPAYASDLSVTAAALEPVLNEIAGLPGAPVRVLQAPELYQQQSGNSVDLRSDRSVRGGPSHVYHLLLPDQMLGPAMTAAEMASQITSMDVPDIVINLTGDAPGASQAQDAIAAALLLAIGQQQVGEISNQPGPDPNLLPGLNHGTPAFAAARRFAALPAAARHTWLMRHMSALRAGQITLAQLP